MTWPAWCLPLALAGLVLPAALAPGAGTQAPRQACLGRTATVVGTARADVLRGTPGPDVVWAGAGADRIQGFGGADLVCAGAGDDVVEAGAGRDRVVAAGGEDLCLDAEAASGCEIDGPSLPGGGALEIGAGSYITARFVPRLVLTLGEGWAPGLERSDQLSLVRQGAGGQVTVFLQRVRGDGDPQAVLAAVAAAPELVARTAPAPADVGGAPGFGQDFALGPPAGTSTRLPVVGVLGGFADFAPGAELRVAVVAAGGVTLAAATYVPSGGLAGAPEAEALVASLRLGIV